MTDAGRPAPAQPLRNEVPPQPHCNEVPPRPRGGEPLRRDEAFRRDAPTVLGYAALAGYAFWLYAFGPALALLQAELHFSYTVLGVYSALWSAGAALVGACFARLARRLPRAALLWYSAAGATVGAGLFAAARTVALTLLGAAVLGFAGTTMLTCIQAILSDRHGERRDRALTEANVGAAACAVLAPLLLGLLQDTPAGWRSALCLPAVILAGLYLRFRHQPLPAAPAGRAATGRARLPLSCWLLATLVAVGIAVEFCLIYFGAEVLTAAGLRTAEAATAMSGFYLGILAGRVGGAWLTRRAGRTIPLLWASLAVTAAGFGLFWLAGQPVPAVAGLFLCGLGIANLYPLSLALTLAAAPGDGDTANARTQLLGGVLVIAAPYLLGSLADHLGLHAAFTVEPVLIGACALLLLAGLRFARRRPGKPMDHPGGTSEDEHRPPSKEAAVTTIRLHQTTTATPEQFLAGLTDFGPGREKIFPNSTDGYLKVHDQGPGQADVTEGSYGIWERLHYDWSDPGRITMTTTDSNMWGGRSGHTYTLTPRPGGTTDVDAVVVREGKNLKGRLFEILLAAGGKRVLGSALARTVKAIEARNYQASAGNS